jgi:hypothetical protein
MERPPTTRLDTRMHDADENPYTPPSAPIITHYRGMMRGCGLLIGLAALLLAAFVAFFVSCLVVSTNDPLRRDFITTSGLLVGTIAAVLVLTVGGLLIVRLLRGKNR